MIAAQLLIGTEPLSDELAFVTTFNQIIGEIGIEVKDEIEDPLLDELGYTPPVWAGGRREWESEKQRRAFFATDGFGKGIPYSRTGAYARGWDVISRTLQGQFELVVGNAEDYAEYVGGSLNQRSMVEALKYQQKMHRNTGWPLSVDTVDFWLEVSLELFDQKLFERLESLGERTTARRRSFRR